MTGIRCFVSIICCSALGTLQFGWNLGVLNNLYKEILGFINATLTSRGGATQRFSVSSYDRDNFIERIYAVITAIFAVGGIFGACLHGRIADSFGRRRGMMLTNLTFIVAAILMCISNYVQSYETIIAGRLLAGFGSGVMSGLVPLYLTEIAPLELRGSLGAVSQLGIALGIFLSEAATIQAMLGADSLWNWALAITGFISLLQIALLQFCPNSPVFTLNIQNDVAATRKVLKTIRQASEKENNDELEILEQRKKQLDSVKTISFCDFFGSPILRKFLLIGIAIHLSQQFSGFNNVLFYSNDIFKKIGVSTRIGQFSTMGIGALLLILTVVSLPLIEIAGRRMLQLSGLLGMAVFSALFTLFNHFEGFIYHYVCIACIMCFVIAFAIGPGPVTWMFMSEMFDDSSKTLAMSVGIAMNWISHFIVGLIYVDLSILLLKNVLIPFVIINFTFFVVLYVFMPETKNKSVETIIAEAGAPRKKYSNDAKNSS